MGRMICFVAMLEFLHTVLQPHTKSLCVLALQNSQFEASTSRSRSQTVNFVPQSYNVKTARYFNLLKTS